MTPRSAPFAAAVALALGMSLPACSASPESFAQDLQAAFEGGDLAAATRLAQLDHTPADLRFFYLSTVADCAEERTVCEVSLAPLDDEFQADLAQQTSEGTLEPSAAPHGLVLVKSRSADGSSSGSMRMPYAQVDGEYRLVALRYTAAELARLKALTNDQLADEFFAMGIYDDESGERRSDWRERATPLPEGGGDVAAEIVAVRERLAQAADAKDPDAAMNAGDAWAEAVFAQNDWQGNAVPRRDRELKLATQALRFRRDIQVERGWRLGDEVVLVFSGRNGADWVERGVMMVKKDGERWSPVGYHTVSYPR
jgi:hypothetical protein